MVYARPSHNKRYMLCLLINGSGFRSARSVALRARSHASLYHVFVVAGILRIPLSQPQKRVIQPKRYDK